MAIIYDSLKILTISFLKSRKYLEPNSYKGGNVIWTRNGQPIGNIDIKVNTVEDNPYLELDYKANGTPINYRVQLVTIPSNLGIGLIWYFLCPVTGKRCRKLYLAGNYFYHRTAYRGMYEKQVQSKKYRELEKVCYFFKTDKLNEQLNAKNFKQTYNGIPTRNYLRLIHKINKAENVPMDMMKRFLTR